MNTIMLTEGTPQASWVQLAPFVLLGVVAIVVGLMSSRKGPR